MSIRDVSVTLAKCLILFATLFCFGSISIAETILLKDVNILPMNTARVVENQALLVKNGLIVAMGNDGTLVVPAGARVIDGQGGYVMPGLSDMHTHIRGYADASTAGASPEIAANQLMLYLATGVTLLRDMSGSTGHIDYQQRINSGELPGPELYFTSPVLEGENAAWKASLKVTDPKEVEALVAGYAADGYWGVKIYHTISAEVFDAVATAAEKYGLPVVGHVPFAVGIDGALRAGMDSIEHLRGYDFDGMSEEELAVDGGDRRSGLSRWTR